MNEDFRTEREVAEVHAHRLARGRIDAIAEFGDERLGLG
jgi:hypothetical protein